MLNIVGKSDSENRLLQSEQELILAKEALEAKTEELAYSLSLVKATLESTTDGIIVTDSCGNILDFNKKFASMWRVPLEVLESGRHYDLRALVAAQVKDPTAFLARTDEIYASMPDESQDVFELKNGKVFERFSKVRIVNGQNVGRVWSFRDITELKAKEDILREEARILEVLNKTGTMLSSQLTLESLVQAVTDAATELSGAKFGAFFYNVLDDKGGSYMLYALSGAPREAFEKFGHPRATKLFGPTFRGEGAIRLDDVLKDPRYGTMPPHHGMPPGHLPVRSYMAVPVVSRSGEVIGGLFFGHPEPGIFTEKAERLVTGVAAQAAIAIDNARLYETAQRARTDAERASAMKDEFLATLSHELRTPLSAILGWSHLLRHNPKGIHDANKALEVIERNARMQAQLIEDLLDMNRITSGKIRLDIQSIQPIGFVQSAIETIKPAASAKGIAMDTHLDAEAGPISGDPNRLQQVIWNLLSNAIKFTPKDGMVRIDLERTTAHIEIRIADTGAGIRPAFLPHVFDRFRQADPSSTRAHGGLGLGLAIVKNLVELHGGTVQVESPGEGLGATFTVRLPLTASPT